jgi:hypothetical protein
VVKCASCYINGFDFDLLLGNCVCFFACNYDCWRLPGNLSGSLLVLFVRSTEAHATFCKIDIATYVCWHSCVHPPQSLPDSHFLIADQHGPECVPQRRVLLLKKVGFLFCRERQNERRSQAILAIPESAWITPTSARWRENLGFNTKG